MATLFLNLLTGEAEGEFDKLSVRSGNNMLNILDLIGTGVGSDNINSVLNPLILNNNILTIDLSAYMLSSDINTLLNNKVNSSQVLTNVPVSALFSDTIYSKPNSEPISYITNLQTTLDSKQNISNNLILSTILPLVSTSASPNTIAIESKFKPSSVSAGSGIVLTQNDTTGILTLNIDTEVITLKSWVIAIFYPR
jgi:hypothetical protein